jgi:hypothetical protein
MLFEELVTRLYALHNFNVNHVAARAVGGSFRVPRDSAGINAKREDQCLQAELLRTNAPWNPDTLRFADFGS